MRLNMTENSSSQNQDSELGLGHQTSRDNIESESIPQDRKSWLARILVSINTAAIVIYGLAKNKEILANISLSLLGIVLVPVLRSSCIFVEELYKTWTWRRNVSDSFKRCFSGISGKPIIAVIFIDVIALLKRSSIEPELDVISILSGVSLGPLITYLLKLNTQSDVDFLRILERKGLHPACTLAWYYYINYLEKALPVFNRSVSSENLQVPDQISNECSDRHTQLSSKKLILLFSDNYKREVGLVDLDNRISRITDNDICVARYKFPVYGLRYNGNEYKYAILYTEEPLEHIKRIRETSKLVHSDPVKDQVKLFHRTLVSEILSKNNFCRNKCIPILITETQSLDNGGLVELIMNDVQSEECVPESNARDDTESPTLPMSTEQPHTEETDGTQVPSLPEETSSSQQGVDIDHAKSYESSDKVIAKASSAPRDPLVFAADEPQEPDDNLGLSRAEKISSSQPFMGTDHAEIDLPRYDLYQSSKNILVPQLRQRKRKEIVGDSAMHNLEMPSSILKGETDLMKQLQKWLGEKCKWHLLYRASRDGWSSRDFHKHCDNKGPTVVLVKANDCIFGGYTHDQHWDSSNIWKHSNSSFLFSLRNKDNLAPFVANIKQGQEQHAIYCDASCGPTFGKGFDLGIRNNPHVNKSFSIFGNTYQLPSGYFHGSEQAKKLLAGQFFFITSEIEVFN